MNYNKPETFVFGLGIGFFVGAIVSMILTWATATNAIGFGLECADRVLNNPEVSIDTTYTIHQQDTTTSYHFVKDR